jgi:hypothetical protein
VFLINKLNLQVEAGALVGEGGANDDESFFLSCLPAQNGHAYRLSTDPVLFSRVRRLTKGLLLRFCSSAANRRSG